MILGYLFICIVLHVGDATTWRHNAKKGQLFEMCVKVKHSGVDVRASGVAVCAEVVALLKTADKYEQMRARLQRFAHSFSLNNMSFEEMWTCTCYLSACAMIVLWREHDTILYAYACVCGDQVYAALR